MKTIGFPIMLFILLGIGLLTGNIRVERGEEVSPKFLPPATPTVEVITEKILGGENPLLDKNPLRYQTAAGR